MKRGNEKSILGMWRGGGCG